MAGPLPVSSQSVSPRAGGRGPRPRRTLEESCLAASGAKDGQSMEREVSIPPPGVCERAGAREPARSEDLAQSKERAKGSRRERLRVLRDRTVGASIVL